MKRTQPYDSAAAVVARSYDQLGGVKRAMAAMGRKASQAYAYADGEQQMPFDCARALAAAGATAPAEDLAALANGMFVPLPDASRGELAAKASALAIEAGQTMAKVIAALSDGKVTPDEARELLRECDETMSAAAYLRAEIAKLCGAGPRVVDLVR